MNRLGNFLAGGGIVIIWLVMWFPGGTILMALTNDSRKLDGWDWVLSVIIPGYGFVKSVATFF